MNEYNNVRNEREIRGYSKPTNNTVIRAMFTYFAITSYIMSWAKLDSAQPGSRYFKHLVRAKTGDVTLAYF
jgi:hypothetical protein